METYTDAETGYDIRVLTADGYYTKPYFDTETTTIDDAKALVTQKDEDKRKLWFVDVQSGEKDLLVELGDRFCAPLNRDKKMLSTDFGWHFF